MVRTIFTDETMELEVGYRPAREFDEAKLLLILSPVDKNDIALNNEIVLDEYDIDELISQLELFKDIISSANEKDKQTKQF
jgi:hypothetical protein